MSAGLFRFDLAEEEYAQQRGIAKRRVVPGAHHPALKFLASGRGDAVFLAAPWPDTAHLDQPVVGELVELAVELWRGASGFQTDGVLWSWTIDLQTGKTAERQLDDKPIEFPRIDDRLAGLPARYAVSVGVIELVRYDLKTGSAVEHSFGTAESPGRPGEAVFVPSTNGPADEGNGSDLVIIDASDFGGAPVATIKLPQRVPYGFHGNWIGS
jgi:carotenoid cleavage dioxygenase-like enzyme